MAARVEPAPKWQPRAEPANPLPKEWPGLSLAKEEGCVFPPGRHVRATPKGSEVTYCVSRFSHWLFLCFSSSRHLFSLAPGTAGRGEPTYFLHVGGDDGQVGILFLTVGFGLFPGLIRFGDPVAALAQGIPTHGAADCRAA